MNILNALVNRTLNVFKACPYRLLHKAPFCLTVREALTIRSANSKAHSQRKNTNPGGYAIHNFCTRGYDLNTNISKDVVLFKYENPKFYKVLNVFGLCQFVFWTYLSHFAFTTLKDAPVEQDDELKWYQRFNLGENKYRNGITIFCFIIGYGILGAVWMFTLRSVRFLILRKGGCEVSFVTYGPFNKNRILTVSLKNISAQESRTTAKVQLPIKVKNRSLFYVLDMRGEFRNPQLFDYTAGLKRRI